MKMRALAVAAIVAALAAACGRQPVIEDVRIEFSDSADDVVVTADTRFEMKPANDDVRRRVEAARAAASSGNDPWAVRFANVHASADSTYLQRERGVLARLTRSVTIPPDDLQLVFADTNVTVRTIRGDGWRELAFYPGSSSRATREQQAHFQNELAAWSRSIAEYQRAMHELYRYLGTRPQRARFLFAAILGEKGDDGVEPAVIEEEQPLVDAVTAAMIEIAERMDATEGRAAGFAEEADLIYNPFPSRITIAVPGTILSSEGFSTAKEREAVVEPIDLFRTLEKLEGRWLTPDPLALLLREQEVKAADIARQERRSTGFVSSISIAEEIRAQLERPKSYVIRWRE